MVLLQDFPSFSNFDNLNLLVETSDDALFNLSSGINEFFNTIDSDSLHSQVNNHLDKFKEKNSGIFTFRYNQTQIWSFFREFNPRFGLNFYMLTIPESQILSKTESKNRVFLTAFIGLFILSAIGIYFLYRRKKTIHSPSNSESLTDILIQDENRFLEFKSSLRWDYRQQKPNPALEEVVIKTIAAFGNSDGGVLLIGVDDDKNILGLENDFNTLKKRDSDYFEIHLRNLLHKAFGVNYITENIRIMFLKTKEKEVCKVEVFKAAEPAFIETKDKNGNKTEKFYVRSGNSSHELKSLKDINDYIKGRFDE